MSSARSNLHWLWLSGAVLLCDRLTKLWADSALMLYESVALTPFFNLTLLYNRGAAFSFLNDAGGWQRWFFLSIALVMGGVILRWLIKLPPKQSGQACALALILGGALGNAWDRLYLGYVVDFIDVHAGGWHWPAFNIADAAISIGVVLLILGMWKKDEGKASND